MQALSVVLLVLLLAVPSFAADPVSDDTLYDQVRIRLANDRDVGGNKIDVKVTQGVVELTGKVKTDRQRSRADKLAKKVKGVQKVVNLLQVSPV